MLGIFEKDFVVSDKKKDEHSDVFTMLLSFVFAAIFLIAAFLSVRLSKLIMFPLKEPATKTFRLAALSAHFHQITWFYRALQFIFGFIFSMMLLSTAVEGYQVFHGGVVRIPSGYSPIAFAITALLVFCFSTFMLAAISWIEEYSTDPDVQKELAGANAEKFVKKLIEATKKDYSAGRSLHNALFVFHKDTAEEFSAEADHILITRRNIFIIETKYKSGVIFADPDTPRWRTSSPHGDGSMRNALLQVKNTAKILSREFSLAEKIIPIVVIQGKNVSIAQGPGNVVAAHDLMCAIHAFEEHGESNPHLNPDDIAKKLLKHCASDSASLKKHISRIREKTEHMKSVDIVRNSSIE